MQKMILDQFGHLVILAHESNQMTIQLCRNLTQYGSHSADQQKLFDQTQSLIKQELSQLTGFTNVILKKSSLTNLICPLTTP